MERRVSLLTLAYALACFGLPVACCLFPVASPTAHAAQILKGTIAEIAGDVQIQPLGSNVPAPARNGRTVEPGDIVITGGSGRAVVTFEQGHLRIDPSSRVVLVRCVSGRDEAYSELAMPYGSVTAFINKETKKEYWFDILTLTTRAEGRGHKKEEAQLSVTHIAGATTVTDSQYGRWRLEPIILTDQPPAVQAALKQDARAAAMVKEYLDDALSQSALISYDVRTTAGAPDVGAVGAPSNTAPPTIIGTAKIGRTITCDPGTWAGDPAPAFTYQWLLDGKEIPGATGPAYTVLESDGNHKISCRVIATNSKGSASATTNEVVVEVEKPSSIDAPKIKGRARIGKSVKCDTGGWAGDPTILYQYQWVLDGKNISEATDPYYLINAEDGFHNLSCQVIATNGGGQTVASSKEFRVEIIKPSNDAPPAVVGNSKFGGKLACVPGKWRGDPKLDWKVRWLRDGKEITGASGLSYTVAEPDGGRKLTCELTFSNKAGSAHAAAPEIDIPIDPPRPIIPPEIVGAGRIGAKLTCKPGQWDGFPTIQYAYQWLRDGVEIKGATGDAYSVTEADGLHKITCRVTATNKSGPVSKGTDEIDIEVIPPKNTRPPVIAGVSKIGEILTCDTGQWAGDPTITYTYQWFRGDKEITGATSPTYKVVLADALQPLACRVTASNKGGQASVSAVIQSAVLPPENKKLPAVTGAPKIGQNLTCEPGEWTGDPTIAYAYQWSRGDQEITGATMADYTLVDEDAFQSMSCRVTASSPFGKMPATSPPVSVDVAKPSNYRRPGFSGDVSVGSSLTVYDGQWRGDPVIKYAYQWLVDDQEIPGATGASFALGLEHAGRKITLRVTASNAAGSEAAFSPPAFVKPQYEVSGITTYKNLFVSGSAPPAPQVPASPTPAGEESMVDGEISVNNPAKLAFPFTVDLTVTDPGGKVIATVSDIPGAGTGRAAMVVPYGFKLPASAPSGKYQARAVVKIKWIGAIEEMPPSRNFYLLNLSPAAPSAGRWIIADVRSDDRIVYPGRSTGGAIRVDAYSTRPETAIIVLTISGPSGKEIFALNKSVTVPVSESPTPFDFQFAVPADAETGVYTATAFLKDAQGAVICLYNSGNPADIFEIKPANSTAAKPQIQLNPVISGTPNLGGKLTVSPGTWTGDAPIEYKYRWTRSGVDIPGATDADYVVTAEDALKQIQCRVTASNAGGAASAVSNSVTAKVTMPSNKTPPVVSAESPTSMKLTCKPGDWTGDPTITFAYQWMRDGAVISGATAASYAAPGSMKPHKYSCRVTASNLGGSASANSNDITFDAAKLKVLAITANQNIYVTGSTDEVSGEITVLNRGTRDIECSADLKVTYPELNGSLVANPTGLTGSIPAMDAAGVTYKFNLNAPTVADRSLASANVFVGPAAALEFAAKSGSSYKLYQIIHPPPSFAAGSLLIGYVSTDIKAIYPGSKVTGNIHADAYTLDAVPVILDVSVFSPSGTIVYTEKLKKTIPNYTGLTPFPFEFYLKDNAEVGLYSVKASVAVDGQNSAGLINTSFDYNYGDKADLFIAIEFDTTVKKPANTKLPAVLGQTRVGKTLTCDVGGWSGDQPMVFHYQWLRDGADIPNARNADYAVIPADVNHSLSCRVSALNAGGKATVTSGSVKVNPSPPVNEAMPELSGKARIGSVLSCSQGDWTGDPTIAFAYQWTRSGGNIPGATAASYVLGWDDAGKAVTCRVTASNPVGSTPVSPTAITLQVYKPSNDAPPQITGKAAINSKLMCSAGVWSGDPSITITYQWLRSGADISGAAQASYVVTEEDGLEALTCRVTATNKAGSTSVSPAALTVNVEKPSNVAPPQLSGTPAIGSKLTCSPGTWAGDPTIKLTYAWTVDGKAVSGATSTEFTPTATHLGGGDNSLVTCEVTAKNLGGSTALAAEPVEILSASAGADAAGDMKTYTAGSVVSGQFNLMNSKAVQRNYTAALTASDPSGKIVFTKNDFTGSAAATASVAVPYTFTLPKTASGGIYKFKVSVTWQ